MNKKKILKYGVLFIVLIAIILGIYIYKEYNRKQINVANITPHYTSTYSSLLNEFSSDEKKANIKYSNKVLEIKGFLKAVDKDDKGSFTLVLGDTLSMSSIRCSMDSTQNAEAAKLIVGSSINVKGICTGYNADELLGSDLILNRCTVK